MSFLWGGMIESIIIMDNFVRIVRSVVKCHNTVTVGTVIKLSHDFDTFVLQKRHSLYV